MLMKINQKYHCSNFFLSEAEIRGLHQAQANLGYSLAWFQSLLRSFFRRLGANSLHLDGEKAPK
jgi:hypothetical protein